MKLARNEKLAARTPLGRQAFAARIRSIRAFTLVEVLVTTLLVLLLVLAGISSLVWLNKTSNRLGDYIAGATVVRSRVEALIAATYNPPASPFTASTVRLTNVAAISLSKAGTNFLVAGTVISVITPVAAGHLVTVTGTFQTPLKPFTVSEQTLINKFSGGQN